MSAFSDLESRKAEARQLARAKRVAAADPAAGPALAKVFPRHLMSMKVIAGYWPLGSEIDCRPLMAALGSSGSTMALPRMASRDGPARFHRWREGDELAPDAFGVLAPSETAAEVEPNLVLTPLLAFDRAGRRLGQGGGHYDRILSVLKPKGVIAVGLAFASQELVEIPAGPDDQGLDWIVTEREAIRARG